jgi:hypothetical protein
VGDVVGINGHCQHVKGEAVCLACLHEWVAVCQAPVDYPLECSKCGSHKGVLRHAIADLDRSVYMCDCGNSILFNIHPDGIMCANCGADVVFD